MQGSDWTKVRGIVAKAVEDMLTELGDEALELGYYPDEANELLTDAVMLQLRQQEAIDRYHVANQTDFTKQSA